HKSRRLNACASASNLSARASGWRPRRSVSSTPQIFLFFLSGAKKGKIESADAQLVRIGRQPYCEIALDPHQDIPASGVHCHIVREPDGSYYLLDSESTF